MESGIGISHKIRESYYRKSSRESSRESSKESSRDLARNQVRNQAQIIGLATRPACGHIPALHALCSLALNYKKEQKRKEIN